MSRTVVIYGAGGQGRVVLDILRCSEDPVVVGFLDSNPALQGTLVDGVLVMGAAAQIPSIQRIYPGLSAVVAIGDNHARQEVANQLREYGVPLTNAIHPRSFISSTATIGSDVTVAAGACICAHVRIGDNVIINTGSIIEHESIIEDGVHVAPGAKLAGRVLVGREAFVGMGANVIECLKVGQSSVVGAGAVVLRDVEPFSVVAGVPARCIRLIKRECE